MRSTNRQFTGRKAITIIELLTTMSIIVIRIGLLTPAMYLAKRSANAIKQKAQLK